MNKKFQTRLIINLKNIISKISGDNITGYAAQSSFFMILSIIPFLMVLMSMIRYLPFTAADILSIIEEIMPSQLYPYVSDIVFDLYDNSSLTLTSITALGVLWATGKGFMSIMRGLNQIYEVERKKNWLLQRIISTLYSLIFMASIILTMITVVFGNRLLQFLGIYFPSISILFSAILNNKLLFTLCIMLLIMLLMYRFVPNRKTNFARELPGAAMSALSWYGFSILFSLYVDYFPNFSNMYGSLTTLIISLIWIYFCMIIVFFGAELNYFLMHRKASSSNREK